MQVFVVLLGTAYEGDQLAGVYSTQEQAVTASELLHMNLSSSQWIGIHTIDLDAPIKLQQWENASQTLESTKQ